MNNYTNPALTFLAVSCLAVATVGTFQLASRYERPHYDTMTIDAESITMVFTTEVAQANLETDKPVRTIMAPHPSNCAHDATFEPRALVQGIGSVRGFCP